MDEPDRPPRVIAIDGPAGSGKSTVARSVAARLGIDHLDTGAMYRSVAFAALRTGIDPDDREMVALLVRHLDISVEAGVVTVDGVDATVEVRGAEVSKAVSAVAANPAVRAELVRRQRKWAEDHDGGVVEGRDIGTVVFPQAALKVFLTAHEDERARRRTRESGDQAYDAVAADISRRDHVDTSRGDSPLSVADDALVIDTTDRSVDEVVEEVVSKL